MTTDFGFHAPKMTDDAVLSDEEALRRIIQYAWREADREGVEECAALLAAALLALDHENAKRDRTGSATARN